ncbi:MAG: hypothetical protein ABI671_17710 [Burkholderiales bacterium]
MQQRQFTVSPLATQPGAPSPATGRTAPIALDAATLKLVAGGMQASGPHGGWSTAAVADGPHGGW